MERRGRFAGGSAAYGLLELMWRGHTHISMLLLGGFCFCFLWRLAKAKRPCLLLKCVLGGAFITVAEFLVGCVVNLWLGLAVWDYSEEPLHIAGQICPRFFLLWCVLSALILPACSWLASHPQPLRKQAEQARLVWRGINPTKNKAEKAS